MYQRCNPINHTFILQNQRLWFEKFNQLSLGAVRRWALVKLAAVAGCSAAPTVRGDAKVRALLRGVMVNSSCWDECKAVIFCVSPPSLQEWEPPAEGRWQTGWERSDTIWIHCSSFLCWRDSGSSCGFSKNPSDLLTQLIRRSFPKVFRACDSLQ